MEDKVRKVLVEGIDERGPEEGDQRKGATAERADERSESLVEVRRRKEEEMTGGSHKEVIYLDVNWTDRPPLPSGPSAVFLGVT